MYSQSASNPSKLSVAAAVLISACGLATHETSVDETPASSQEIRASDRASFARGRILVQPRAGLPEEALAAIVSVHNGRAKKIGQSDLYVVEVPAATEQAAVAKLQHNPHLKFAELDRYLEATSVPNDPYYGSQWHLPKIGAPTAWGIAQGAGVTVAILDSGANLHPDLAGQLVPGWNFWDNNSDTTDLTGHGTKILGVGAAVSNNGTGVAGLATQAKFMPVRITEPTVGGTYDSYLIQGIVYAADNGVRLANASFRNVMGSAAKIEAAQYMRNKGGLVTVTSGNDGADMGYTATPSMIQVGATDRNDLRPIFSSYGNFVDVAAPGVDIWTTTKEGDYAAPQGTSLSAPIVAGVLALMMSANPALSNVEIENLLFTSAVDIGEPGKDIYSGYGRVDATAAVQAALNATPAADTQAPTAAITSPDNGATVSSLVPINVSAADNVGVTHVALIVNGTTVATEISPPYTFTWDSKGTANGTAYLVAQAFDAAGNRATSTAVSVTVSNNATPPPPTTDITAPVVKIVNPVSGNVSGTVTITVNASDDSGAAGIQLAIYVDGAFKASGSGNTLSMSWNTRGKGMTGSHTITATARDAAGNVSSSSNTVNVVK